MKRVSFRIPLQKLSIQWLGSNEKKKLDLYQTLVDKFIRTHESKRLKVQVNPIRSDHFDQTDPYSDKMSKESSRESLT